RRIHEVLAEVKMEEWVHQKVGRFSKGMKQRVNIAAALLADPEIVILDEPSTGLDPRGMSEVRDIVRGLKRSSRLIFMSSHILSEVVDVCDEVALLNRGKLLFYDTLDRVTARFADGAAVAVDAEFARPVSDEDARGRIATLPGVVGWDRAGPQRLSLRIQGGAAAQASVLERLAGLSLGLLSFRESKSALEEVYLREIDRGDM
ncbi:MAG TPA: ABC transporter ATP-binding protein, partial [Thermoplasmata archaeon]|nr:ABC transporter ATP-binding protein [Thermoplasmata archaeon]